MSDVILHPPEGGESFMAAGTLILIKLRSEATGGRYSVTEYHLPPDFSGPPPHVHSVFEHAWQVLEGSIQVQVGAVVQQLPAGSFVFVPARTPHTFSNPGSQPARLLAVDSPGGLEEYYTELARAFPPGTPLDRSVVAEIQKRFDTHPAT
ncbi:hypothetical protein GCM10008955_23730 [Deinococcus malanensis]|uniref:Cupin type-2 domain-containing protein n=1 Tax=Deinococcus malanensis TaxID=1706855 RepID=A0ABQ2EWG2_9DEIO|nr:cupin domain-containing protein [Deinococcus malanensis]GGK29181.1 hypothetical protein GCM10008955_23730 [Deinococcus malanensis]